MKQQAWEVFGGVMLGDAGLVIWHGRNACLEINLSGSKTVNYLSYVKGALVAIDMPVSPWYPRLYKSISRGKPYIRCTLRTRCLPLLTEEYHRWYPSGRKKVPVDTKLTPMCLAHWFMGDGSSSYQKNQTQVKTYFASVSFAEEDIEVLEAQLHDMGLHTGRTHFLVSGGVGIAITILQDSVDKFMDIISPYIVEPYMYKIKYRGTRLVLERVKQEVKYGSG